MVSVNYQPGPVSRSTLDYVMVSVTRQLSTCPLVDRRLCYGKCQLSPLFIYVEISSIIRIHTWCRNISKHYLKKYYFILILEMCHLISLRLAQTTNRTIKFSHSHYFFNVPKPVMAIFRSLKQSSIKCSEKILYISYILLPKFHWDINWSITKYLMENVRLLIGELGNNIVLKVVTWHALSTLIKRVRQLKKQHQQHENEYNIKH